MDDDLIDWLIINGYSLEGTVSDKTGILRMQFINSTGHYVDIYNNSLLGEN